MTDAQIEMILRKAPQPPPPHGLLERLQADVALPARARANGDHLNLSSFLRRWFPAIAFGVFFLSCVVIIGLQSNIVGQVKEENQQLRAANRQAVPKTGVTALVPPTSQEGYYAKENWSYCGYATPEAALLSVIWAMREGDTETFRASLAPEEMARTDKEWEGKTEAEISADAKRETDKISSIRILESRTLSDGEVVLSVYAAGGEDKVQKISLKRFGADWKLAGPKRD